MHRKLPLTNGGFALVDEEDFLRFSRRSWRTNRAGYARATTTVGRKAERKTASFLLHRLVLGASPGQWIDHINRDKLDNRRANLRLATVSQNTANHPGYGHSSRYKGVTWNKRARRWQVAVQHRYVGVFASEEDAARAYDRAALAAYGEFAFLNFPAGAERDA